MFSGAAVFRFIGKTDRFIEVMGIFRHRIFNDLIDNRWVFSRFLHDFFLCTLKKSLHFVSVKKANLNNHFPIIPTP
jgi:hypothetical protein